MAYKKGNKGHLIHGMAGTPIYNVWCNMIRRTSNPKTWNYHRYGGRGIAVCKRWNKFEKFYNDMKEGYLAHLTLDRINNDKGYFKKNCRWVSKAEQSRNRRDNVKYKGETLAEAERRLSLKAGTIHMRLKSGWSFERSFTETRYQRRVYYPL